MIAWPYKYAAVLVALLVAFTAGDLRGRHAVKKDWAAADQALALAAAKHVAATAEANTRVVTEYVDRIQTVEKRVPVVRDRIVELCRAADAERVSGAGDPAPAATPDPDVGSLDGLAADLPENRLNVEQCQALIRAVTPQARTP